MIFDEMWPCVVAFVLIFLPKFLRQPIYRGIADRVGYLELEHRDVLTVQKAAFHYVIVVGNIGAMISLRSGVSLMAPGDGANWKEVASVLVLGCWLAVVLFGFGALSEWHRLFEVIVVGLTLACIVAIVIGTIAVSARP